MKRKILLLALVLLLACACAACGDDENNAGEWQLRAAEYEGLLCEPDVFSVVAHLTLEKDGTGRLTIDEYGYAITSWSVKKDTVRLKLLETTMEGTYRDGYIVLTFDDGVRLWFSKEGAEVQPLELLDVEGYLDAYDALVASGGAMPAD